MNPNRRSFMKTASGVALVGVPGLSAAARLSAPAGLLLGGMAGAASDAALNTGPQVVAMPVTFAGLLWRRLSEAEEKRARWYALWREHRIRVRRHFENKQSAKYVWYRDELKRLRREEHARRSCWNINQTGPAGRPTGDTAYVRRRARLLNAFKLARIDPPKWALW